MSDETVALDKLFRGDEGAKGEFIEKYQRLVWHVIRKTVRADRLALMGNDLFGDVILHLFQDNFRVLRSFQGKSKFVTWLYTVVRFRVMEAVRRESALQQRLVRADDRAGKDGPEDFWESFEDPAIREQADLEGFMEQRNAVREAVMQLPEDRKAFILDLVFRETSTEDMMAKYGLGSRNSVYSRKAKIIEELRMRVENAQETGSG